MPTDSRNFTPLRQPSSFRFMLPSRLNTTTDPNQPIVPTTQRSRNLRSIIHNCVRNMVAQDPEMANYLHGENRRKFFIDYFCNAVLIGNVNKVYFIQSNPVSRVDIDKPVNNTGLTALQMAAVNGYSDLLRVLFHFGASTNIVDGSGNTALSFALARSDRNTLQGDAVGQLSDVAMLIGYTQIRTLKTNGLDTFLPADLEKLKDERYKHYVDELKNEYPEFQYLSF